MTSDTAPLPARYGREAESPVQPIALPGATSQARQAPRRQQAPPPAPSHLSAGAARPQLYRVSRLVGAVAVALLLTASLAAPGAVTAAALPVAVAGALLGLPHGAVDHVVPGWVAGRALPRPALAVLLTGYVGMVAVGAAALRLAPTATLTVFLLVAAWHFGRGEAASAAEAAGRRVPGAAEDLLPVAAHGAVTVALPLLASPEVVAPLLAALAPGLAPPSGLARRVWLVAVLGLALVSAGRLAGAGRRVEAGELLLLTALFGLVHPLAAFGVYFGCWHALRHTARLVDLAAGDGPVRVGVRRFAAQAALPTAGALAVLGGVWATARLASGDRAGSGLLAAEIATLVALTFPHAVVVTWLDEVLHLRRRRRAGTRLS